MERRNRSGSGSAEDVVLRLVQEHAAELLRFARRFSYCADDAHDAYQRSVEILVRRMRVEPPGEPLRWLRTVLRHEALAVRAQREQLVGRVEIDLDRHEDRRQEDLADRVVGDERLRQTAEALQRLKPQEVTALVLRAEGLSYKEICARTGWTYTRCNRAITEGRAALRSRLGAIESGAECERWLPLLSRLADGEATAEQLADLRPHLRACAACRATLRDFHAAPARVAALVPPVVVPLAVEAATGSAWGHVESAVHALGERATLAVARMQGAIEAASGTKVAAVAASTAALAGGGAAMEHVARQAGVRAAPLVRTVDAGPTAATRLTIADPLGAAQRTAAGRARRERADRGEFAAPPSSAPEFTPGARPAAEFASAPAPPTAISTAATAPTASPQPPGTTSGGSPPEFVGP